LKIYKIVFRPR